MKYKKKILIIAGSDPSGGAGIQADIKTASAHGVYSSSVITCLTAQNTKKVANINYPPISFLKSQLETLFTDIKYDAIKIGMLGSKEIIDEVAKSLDKYAKKTPLILDTVMVATSGDLLLQENAVLCLKEKLIPRALIVTPNIDEAEVLSEMKIENVADMKKAAIIIKDLGAKNVLIKGGHLNFSDNKIRSILLDNKNKFSVITNKKIGTKNLHGTGCTLASAIACNIAQSYDVLESARLANRYVSLVIKNSLKVGKGSLVLGF